MSEDSLWEDGGSIFRPSYSATWLNCAGSLVPSRQASDKAGYDAAVGTVFHMLIADWLTTGKRPDHWLGKEILVEREDRSAEYLITVDDEMFAYGLECLQYIELFDGDRFIETRVDISDLTPIPKQGGTADVAFCSPGYLDIIDWKYGRGVQVFAEGNTQELLYGWGFFKRFDRKYNFQRIRLHIAQPRLNHWDSWEISRDELIEWAAWAKERAHYAWNRKASRSPSPKACQWCKVRVDCAALEAAREAIVDQTFWAIDGNEVSGADMQQVVNRGSRKTPQLPAPVTLPTEQLARILRYRRLMESWFSDISEELMKRAQDGEQLDGWKIVEGRSRRRWNDEQVAAEKLASVGLDEDEIYERQVISPRQAEKKLRAIGIGGRLLNSFVRTIAYKPPGKPTLAPAGDNRLELPDLADSFDAEEDETAL